LIRALTAADAAAFQALRLRGLRDVPHAFGRTYDEAAATPLPTIAVRLQAGETGDATFALGALLVRARQGAGLEQPTLTVVPESTAARGVYVSRGFRPFGVEPKALKHDGRYHDLEYLRLPPLGDEQA
jgi:hypothetical protein